MFVFLVQTVHLFNELLAGFDLASELGFVKFWVKSYETIRNLLPKCS